MEWSKFGSEWALHTCPRASCDGTGIKNGLHVQQLRGGGGGGGGINVS